MKILLTIFFLFVATGSQAVRFWKLEKHAETICYDSVQVCLKTRHVIAVEAGHLAANAPNQLLYDTQRHLLLSYNMDKKTHSVYSFDTNRWSNDVAPTQEHRYWNNTASYSPEDPSILSFGGYGFYKYTNELIRLKPYQDRIENTVTLPEIDSRYCPASVIVDDIIYIWGGRGCKSVRQELFPPCYYDLYAVNLKSLQVRKVWGSSKVGVDFLAGENLFYDKDNDCFYVFAIKEKGILLKIDVRKKTFDKIALPLGEDMEAHYMYANNTEYKRALAEVINHKMDICYPLNHQVYANKTNCLSDWSDRDYGPRWLAGIRTTFRPF